MNEKPTYIEIKEGIALADKLIGHKKGDLISVERPMVGIIDTVKVISIMDKYLYLMYQIMDEVYTNPHSGFPMQSFTFEDPSPEGMVKQLVEIFGASGTMLKKQQDKQFSQYYNYQLSLTELVVQIYSSDYIGAYFNLISSRDGITIIPQMYYTISETFEESQIVIDIGSLITIQQISTHLNLTFSKKFNRSGVS